jgi:hypothetical protein
MIVVVIWISSQPHSPINNLCFRQNTGDLVGVSFTTGLALEKVG